MYECHKTAKSESISAFYLADPNINIKKDNFKFDKFYELRKFFRLESKQNYSRKKKKKKMSRTIWADLSRKMNGKNSDINSICFQSLEPKIFY